MEPVRTDVRRATNPIGEAILQVAFFGEGGDCVTVDMTGMDLSDDASAIQRARAILVQTASFHTAANEYDAQSNGDFDEVLATRVNDDAGQTYIFEYRDGETGRQIPPAKMPGLEAARDEAIRSAIDMLADLQPGIDDLSGWLVRVRDGNGALLCTVDVSQAEANRARFS